MLNALHGIARQIRQDDRNGLALGVDEETKGWPIRYGGCAGTVWVDGVGERGDKILQHDFTAHAHRHGVCTGAVAVKDARLGIGPRCRLGDAEGWGQNRAGSGKQIAPFQRGQGAGRWLGRASLTGVGGADGANGSRFFYKIAHFAHATVQIAGTVLQ